MKTRAAFIIAVCLLALRAGAAEDPFDLRSRLGPLLPAPPTAAPTQGGEVAVESVESTHLLAVRTARPPRIDGDLDDPAWEHAPAYTGFVETFPREGAVPTERTEVRVLYDDDALYVAVRCFDTAPDLILRQLGRRDAQPPSDRVTVYVDSNHDRRNAFAFSVSAAGVLADSVLYNDVNETNTWDAVWAGSARMNASGWSAELAIPLNTFRFSDASSQVWGFLVEREIPRTHQMFGTTLVPRSARGRVSIFGVLRGIAGILPRPDVELTPYVIARGTAAPRDGDRAHPRLVYPTADVGADLKVGLTRSLTLNAALNPDFGQVEADQVILNLKNVELEFPEKRHFFNEGLDLFEQVGGDIGIPNQMFYSRRIGLTTPILGAARMTGTVAGGVETGLLDALVMGASRPTVAADGSGPPDARYRFHPEQPFHLGPNFDFPGERRVTMNDLAAVVRERISDHVSVGERFTSSVPLSQRCYPGDFGTAASASGLSYDRDLCAATGQNAGGIDLDARTADGDYGVLGQLEGSQWLGGSKAGTVFPDGTVLHDGDLGWGGYARVGKLGGEGFRYDVFGDVASPRLDLNAMGFQPIQNDQLWAAELGYTRPSGVGALRSLDAVVVGKVYHTADPHVLPLSRSLKLDVNLVLPGFQHLRTTWSFEDPKLDIRELGVRSEAAALARIPMQRQPNATALLLLGTDSNRQFTFEGSVTGLGVLAEGVGRTELGYQLEATLGFHPQARLETGLVATYNMSPQGIRFFGGDPGAGHYITGALHSEFVSMLLRQLWVLTPELTLQLYAQLFSAQGHYGPFFSIDRSPGQTIRLADLVGAGAEPDADFAELSLNINLLLRWEFRPGSTLFVGYVRAQEGALTGNEGRSTWSQLSRLPAAPANDTLFVKLSYWLNR